MYSLNRFASSLTLRLYCTSNFIMNLSLEKFLLIVDALMEFCTVYFALLRRLNDHFRAECINTAFDGDAILNVALQTTGSPGVVCVIKS